MSTWVVADPDCGAVRASLTLVTADEPDDARLKGQGSVPAAD
ncbi:hypothetical protein ACFXEL_03200 [Streptomyces sp. NPDC059382]